MAAEPPVAGLDQPCPVCGQISGDHTVREWAACLGTPTTNLPFQEVPQDAVAAAAGENIRRSFDIDSDIVIADHVVVKALTLSGASGPIQVHLPALLHEFQVGVPGRPPVEVAKVLFTGDTQSVRGFGRLVRDSANGAANAAERKAA